MPLIKPLPVTTSASLDGTAAMVLAKPPGLAIGDLLFVVMSYRGAVNLWDTAGRPGSFTWIADNIGTGGVVMQAGYRVVDGSEAASWSFAVTGAGTGGRKVGMAFGIRNGTTPVTVATSPGVNPTVFNPVVPTANNSLVLGYVGYVAGLPPTSAMDELIQYIVTVSPGDTTDGALIQKYGQPSGVSVAPSAGGMPANSTTLTLAIPPLGGSSDGPETDLRATSMAVEELHGTGDSDIRVTSMAVEVLRSVTLLPEPPAADESQEEAAIYLGTIH